MLPNTISNYLYIMLITLKYCYLIILVFPFLMTNFKTLILIKNTKWKKRILNHFLSSFRSKHDPGIRTKSWTRWSGRDHNKPKLYNPIRVSSYARIQSFLCWICERECVTWQLYLLWDCRCQSYIYGWGRLLNGVWHRRWNHHHPSQWIRGWLHPPHHDSLRTWICRRVQYLLLFKPKYVLFL